MAETAAAPPKKEEPPITIKKYANRRLYNTATSTYVTLDHLAQMVKDGAEFVVYDAKTGEDITRQVLTHIIVEEEGKGQSLLPLSFLRHLISFYGDSLQTIVPRYLDFSMQSFARNQEQMRTYMGDALTGLMPFGRFEEMGKQNMVLFENAMKMFSPFFPGEVGRGPAARETPGEKPKTGGEDEIEDLRAKLERMQRQLDQLTGGKKE
ncbi:MAG: polyhydroxyalkanoate synthesis repressor PhaR [Rhodospirillales bacterium]|nr:polyhydroxyalkanoate synthesis repressor PhaR [Rhodospirillales bacterium]MSP79963.1 polyhydroxyalkanoate synthesis repressor PhaR [Rhodospirillales bacterium]